MGSLDSLVLTWLAKSNYWDTIDIQDFPTQVLKIALKGRVFMLVERMLAFGFWFDESYRTLETIAAGLVASGRDKDLVDFLRRVGLTVNLVVHIKKWIFDFTDGVIPKSATGGFTRSGLGNANAQQGFRGDDVGGITGGFLSVFGAEESTPYSFSATAIGDSQYSVANTWKWVKVNNW
ncbi:hypothetical protein HDU76_009895 [Blyttiomyces sp. JEL0837]|nr:hypothetical protein HDU76_009895 [Blyttiomyces sp. JEL0837]